MLWMVVFEQGDADLPIGKDANRRFGVAKPRADARIEHG